MTFCYRLLIVCSTITLLFACVADRNIYIPTTMSKKAQEVLENLSAAKAYQMAFPAPDALDAWRKLHAEMEQLSLLGSLKALAANEVCLKKITLGGVLVSDMRPKGWKDNHKVLIYTHGGAYVMNSDESTYTISAPMARATELRVISVNYTCAPFAKWKEIQEQVISVIKALLAEGYSMKDIALYGDSAGGGLVTSTVLNLRDRGMGMPAAVVLWSPWADLTNAGDSAQTLAGADPVLTYAASLENSALAFADGVNLKDPRVSPLYADFSKGFSPALIQEGTKCIFLSTSVRLYQALLASGQTAELDVYEGMWHVFQGFGVPESEVAIKKAAAFINKHLK